MVGVPASAINSLLTHNIPAIKLGNSKSLPYMQFLEESLLMD